MTDTLDRLQSVLADRYRIERLLGEGGMATVYLAEDLANHRHVAIKVLRPEIAAAVGAERFLREIEVTANLDHPHIVPLFDSGEVDGHLFYVMPYVEGETLRARLDRESQLPVEDAISISRDVAAALGYAHARGIVHRDIKPENILLSAGLALLATAVAVAGVGAAIGLRSPANDEVTDASLAILPITSPTDDETSPTFRIGLYWSAQSNATGETGIRGRSCQWYGNGSGNSRPQFKR